MRNFSTMELISFVESCEEVVDPEFAALLCLPLPLPENYMRAD